MTLVYIYEFTDRSIYKLIDVGFCAADLWKLEEIHGKLIRKYIKKMSVSERR